MKPGIDRDNWNGPQGGLARTTDPPTSQKAARKVDAKNQRGRTLLFIYHYPGATGPESCPLNAQARLTELSDQGLIAELGERNGARTWCATAKGVELARRIGGYSS